MISRSAYSGPVLTVRYQYLVTISTSWTSSRRLGVPPGPVSVIQLFTNQQCKAVCCLRQITSILQRCALTAAIGEEAARVPEPPLSQNRLAATGPAAANHGWLSTSILHFYALPPRAPFSLQSHDSQAFPVVASTSMMMAIVRSIEPECLSIVFFINDRQSRVMLQSSCS